MDGVHVGSPDLDEIKKYFSRFAMEEDSQQSTPKHIKEVANDISSSGDELSDSFKEFLQKALDEKKAKKEEPAPESPESTSDVPIYVGTPTLEEAKNFFARTGNLSRFDVTGTNTSSEIDLSFEEFLNARRKQAKEINPKKEKDNVDVVM